MSINLVNPESLGRFAAIVGGAIEPPSTETFSYDDSALMFVGSSGDGSVDGKQFRAMYREWNFEVKGSSISLSLWLGTGEVFIEVDGTLVEQETGTTWEDVVAPIPNDGQWHFVSVRRRDYNGGMTLNKSDPLVSVTGNPPQIRYPVNYASPLIDCRIAASGSYCQGDGTLGDSSYGRPIYQHFGYLRFRAATDSIRVRLLNPGSVGVYQDGAYLGSLTTTDVHPDFSWCPSAVTTNSSAESEFIIAGDFHIQAISAENVNTSALAAEDTWQIFGDSITRGFGVTNAWNKWGGQLGIIKRKGVRLYGVDGATLAGSAASVGGWANDVDPKYTFLMYGRNDVGVTSVANYKNAMYTALHDLCGVASVTKIYVIGMLNYTGNGSGRTDLNTAASEVCAGGATGSGTLTAPEIAKITYINSDGLINPATHTSDGTHLNDAGGIALAAALSPLIA